jgi:uncharacterized membrane protein
MAATILAAGAGEAFREDRKREIPESMQRTLDDHADAGDTLRLTMVFLTLALVAALFTGRRTALRVVAALLALVAIFFVIRTGHLGSELVWSDNA